MNGSRRNGVVTFFQLLHAPLLLQNVSTSNNTDAVSATTQLASVCVCVVLVEGEPVNGLAVTRGQHIYCQTQVDTWDDRLLLIVDDCIFSPFAQPSNITYRFIDNRSVRQCTYYMHTTDVRLMVYTPMLLQLCQLHTPPISKEVL